MCLWLGAGFKADSESEVCRTQRLSAWKRLQMKKSEFIKVVAAKVFVPSSLYLPRGL